MTPIGHAVSGYLIGRPLARLPLLAVVLGAVAPDIDFALLWRDDFNELHRTFTHSLLFVAVFAGGAALLTGAQRRRVFFAGAAIGGLLHLFTDAIFDGNPSNGLGVAWLWPATDEAWTPFNAMALLTFDTPDAGWGDVGGMLPQAAWALIVEVAFCVALAIFLRLIWRPATR